MAEIITGYTENGWFPHFAIKKMVATQQVY